MVARSLSIALESIIREMIRTTALLCPAGARTTKNSMSAFAGRSFRKNRVSHKKRVLWKTRNFAGFPAFSHILGIGQWCIVRVLKSAERV
jgi:hypothetical protein